jgi:DNA-binding MarR family transcriptional regulator
MERHTAALDRVLELVVLLNEDMTQSLARDGLTVSRAHVLWELGHRGPCTQRMLADALHVSARTVTGLVDGLVATGFVTREPHPGDRRATLVTVTAHGQRVTESMRAGQVEFATALFGDMSESRLAGFTAGLDHVLDRIRTLTAEQAQPVERARPVEQAQYAGRKADESSAIGYSTVERR